MAVSTLEPVKKFKNRDGSINDKFNLNIVKSKYKGIENFLDINYSRRNGPNGMNTTDRAHS
jgi:hypothetical protein